MKTNDLTMIRDHLKFLKLLKMERGLDEVLSWAEKQNQPILSVLNRLFEIEATALIKGLLRKVVNSTRWTTIVSGDRKML